MTARSPEERTVALIKQVMPSELGGGVDWRVYDRRVRSPMTLVLQEAERQLGKPFVTVWVDGGFPELFSLGGLPSPVAVFNTRYLGFSAAVRRLLATQASGSVHVGMVRQNALRAVAEMSLRRGNTDDAVRCFLLSAVVDSWFNPDHEQLADLELAELNEGYMALWFFGLAHEIGHSRVLPDQANGPLGDAALERSVEDYVHAFAELNNLEAEPLLASVRVDSTSPLSPRHLRGEVSADMFAASVVAQASMDIIEEYGQQQFRPFALVAELVAYGNVISFLQRCANVATLLRERACGEQTSATARLMRFRLQPVAGMVRLRFIKWYLTETLADLLAERITEVGEKVDKMASLFDHVVTASDRALSDAWRDAFSPEPALAALFRELQRKLGDDWLRQSEVDRFVELGRRCRADGSAFERLASLSR